MRTRRPPFTPQELSWLEEAYTAGTSTGVLAKQLNSTPGVIRVKLHQLKIFRPPKQLKIQHTRTPNNWSYKDTQELMRLHKHGADFTELCRHFSISSATLRRRLHRAGATSSYPRNLFALTARRVLQEPVLVYELRSRGLRHHGEAHPHPHHPRKVSRVRMLLRQELPRTFVCPSLLPEVHPM